MPYLRDFLDLSYSEIRSHIISNEEIEYLMPSRDSIKDKTEKEKNFRANLESCVEIILNEVNKRYSEFERNRGYDIHKEFFKDYVLEGRVDKKDSKKEAYMISEEEAVVPTLKDGKAKYRVKTGGRGPQSSIKICVCFVDYRWIRNGELRVPTDRGILISASRGNASKGSTLEVLTR